ncbi:MAG: tetraacyldisaccharide 4'-kinase [candidate division Zixibacteria bacterium RBG_16_48_11]|nr:MAG: tetraacyldisaccharide 4'-kinase [candidate division Zixibacteria bacterium RBG_16_48_11]
MLFQLLDSYLKSDQRPRLVRKIYCLVLRILSALYLCGYWIRKSLYQTGLLRPVRVNIPVISVGNLTWGGTGKTPLVIYLALCLEKSGQRVVILTRGYKRKTKEQIILDQKNLKAMNWQKCGDEPYLICQSLQNTAVVINAKRSKAARWAEENLKPDVFILDDGFQHWKLHRDLEIVLIDSQNPFGNGRLQPLGILREPLEALSRADLVILSKVSGREISAELHQKVSSYYRGETLQTKYKLSSIRELETGQEFVLSDLKRKKLLAFCGIGNPDSFYSLLEQSELRVGKKLSFPDHYSYDKFDFLTLEKEGLKIGADYLATTAKDRLKIPANLQLQLPLLIFEIEVEVISGERVLWQQIEQILQK